MNLIGQYDSPFVRRVALALRFYGIPFEHSPWSTFGDAEKIAIYNPLMRVPTLVLDDGEVLVESTAMLDYLDELAGPSRALIPDCGHVRREVLYICGLATGLADKGVSLLYERVLRSERSSRWIERCRTQIAGVFDRLEEDRAQHKTQFWFGDQITHADIAAACVIRFTREAHEGLFDDNRYAALARHAETCEALQPFQDIVQPLAPPS
ncbi:MAG: glutathione S-transferase family protein [Pseudomonadota bacterium]